MNWNDLLKELYTSTTYQGFPKSFRDKIEARLPSCTSEQLEQVKLLINYDRENIKTFMEESRKFQVGLQKKIMALKEIIDNQQMMNEFNAKNGSIDNL